MLADQLILFLMVVCHQPYSEILAMDNALSWRLFQMSGQIVSSLIGPGGDMPLRESTNTVLPNLPPPPTK